MHLDMQAGESPALPGRVVRACDRCRRQKLKCDTAKPCTLCTRSGVFCQTSPSSHRRSKRKRTETKGNSRCRHHSDQNQDDRRLPENGIRSHHSHAASPPARQQFVPSTSTIGLARNILGDNAGDDITGESTIPDDAGPRIPQHSIWTLRGMQMPPKAVINALIDSYFQRIHWFIFIFHETSFRIQVREVLTKAVWRHEDRDMVVLVLMVSAMGLQSGLEDSTWSGLELLHEYALDPSLLSQNLIAEVRLHLWDILDDCRLEGVQITSLLASFCVYYSSPTLAWSASGMAIRSAYALSLDSQEVALSDPIVEQVRHRCWNFMIVSDAFTSFIYGRHGMVDFNITNIHILREMDDTCFDSSLLNLTQAYGPMTRLSFHMFKFKLYRIINQVLAKFKILQHNCVNFDDYIMAVGHEVQNAEMLLEQWHAELSPFFDYKNWKDGDPWKTFESEFASLPDAGQGAGEILLLQAMTLQVTYDGAIILAHRPLLECMLPKSPQPSTRPQSMVDLIQESLDTATKAALRISQVPVRRLEKHLSVSFVFMHLFIAGVILCILPMIRPLSHSAHEAKAGVMKVIQASRVMGSKNRIARHTEKLLTELLKVTHQREIENALNIAVPPSHYENFSEQALLPGSQDGNPSRSCSQVNKNASTLEAGRGAIGPTQPKSTDCASAANPGYQENNNWINVESSLGGLIEPQMDHVNAYSNGGLWIDDQLDDAFRTFGESIFNLVPDDQHSTWSWRGAFR